MDELVDMTQARDMLEVGCGEGEALQRLPETGGRLAALDLGATETRRSRRVAPRADVQQAAVEHLPFADKSFDLVLALEVLEHVAAPQAALGELARVSRQWVLISVPREPWWRVLNFARGKYRAEWGNSPGHIQHWDRPALVELVASRFRVEAVRTPLPWTMVLARVV
jgi:ubiquinone/menaquinone biosynthesis C-methylase UbiE